MDFYCIERTTLLDNPSVMTLEEPGLHSVHCLVDVGSCVGSPFEILLNPVSGQGLFVRGFRLDDSSKETIISLARETGACGTCSGSGTLHAGFRAVMDAVVIDLNEGSMEVPPIISVTEAQASHDLSDACLEVFGIQDITAVLNETNTTIGIVTEVHTRTNLQRKQIIHGVLMLISWGYLLASGVAFAKFLKHRPGDVWFKIHRFCQVAGLSLACIGWIIALRNFQVFSDKGLNSYRHGILGCATMTLGLLQPLNAILRPHAAKDGEERTPQRKAWELLHKGLGYLALLLAFATIGIGTTIVPDVGDQKAFQMAFGIGTGSLLLILLVGLQCDRIFFESGPVKFDAGQKGGNDMEIEEQGPLNEVNER